MMSNWKASPIPIGLPYTGPYANGTAAYCMNRGTFWTTWLLPILSDLNKGSDVIPDTPDVEYHPDRDKYKWSSGPRYHLGGDSSSATYYNFQPDGPSSWSWKGQSLSAQNSLSGGGNTQTLTESCLSILSSRTQYSD